MMPLGYLIITTFAIYLLGMGMTVFLPGRFMRLILAIFGTLGSLSLLIFGWQCFFSPNPYRALLWSIPNIGRLAINVDSLSAFFLIVEGLLFSVISIFSYEYLKHYSRRLNLRMFVFLYFLLLISVAVIPMSGDIFSFLITWEAMSILCYLLVNSEYENDDAKQAGYLMLAVGEAGTLAILAAFIILFNLTGAIDFTAIKSSIYSMGAGMRWIVFLLFFLGFSTKIGLVPLSFWLPKAHPVAPANISAILSGLILNLGVYGILRVNFSLMPVGMLGPGVVILIVGSISAFVGILYAAIENDFKKILAHSSIENMGIVCTGIGASLIFKTLGHPIYSSIALVAALYHMINHSVYKSLLFMGAGVIDTHAGTRDLDKMGGLLKKMPWTGFFMLVGVLAISAMPPFNGFVSEWLMLESLLRSVELSSLGVKMAFIVSGVLLALTAGLAVTCFVRAFAMGFLGIPRLEAIKNAREAGKAVLFPLASLAVMCLILGITPTYTIPALNRITKPFTGANASAALVPNFFRDTHTREELSPKFISEFHDVGAQIGKDIIPGRGLVVLHRGGDKNPVVFAMSTTYMFIMLILLGICMIVLRFTVFRRRKIQFRSRWDGGIKRLLPEMTYTATGFAQPVRVLFEAVLRPRKVNRHEVISEHFRVLIERKSVEIHLIDRLILYPVSSLSKWIASRVARIHNGRINSYVTYVLLTLIIFLIIASIF